MRSSEPSANRRAQMYAMIERYLGSDQSQTVFCQSEQISKSTFAYWLRRYRQDKPGSTEPAFRPIPIRPSSLIVHCEIEFPDGLILRIYG
jgi:transposase-like protein